MADDPLQSEKRQLSGPTLEDLEGVRFEEPEFGSHLVTTCHRLRKKPVDRFSVEDFRIMIGQNMGLPHLLPLALTVLEADPLAEGDFYPGDLLSAVLRAVRAGLRDEPELRRRLMDVACRVEALIGSTGGSGNRRAEAELLGAIKEFTAGQTSTG